MRWSSPPADATGATSCGSACLRSASATCARSPPPWGLSLFRIEASATQRSQHVGQLLPADSFLKRGTGGQREIFVRAIMRGGHLMTAQVHERLVLDGEDTTMNCDPPLPPHHPRIVPRPDAHMREVDVIMNSTACWRRYVGSWELRDGRLYLLAIEGRYQL